MLPFEHRSIAGYIKNSTEQCECATRDIRSHSEVVDALGYMTESSSRDLASRIEERLIFKAYKVLYNLSLLMVTVLKTTNIYFL